MHYELKQRVIAVRNLPTMEIREWLITPGTEHGLVARLRDRGWTAFAHGPRVRIAVLTDAERALS